MLARFNIKNLSFRKRQLIISFERPLVEIASDLYGNWAKGFGLNGPAFKQPASDQFAQEVEVESKVEEDGHKPDKSYVESVGVVVAPKEVFAGIRHSGFLF